MTPPKPSARPKYASPQERSAEFAAHQEKLKEEAAARRQAAVDEPTASASRAPRAAAADAPASTTASTPRRNCAGGAAGPTPARVTTHPSDACLHHRMRGRGVTEFRL